MTPSERHFLSNLIEALLKANSPEDYIRLTSGKALDLEVSEELKKSLLRLADLRESLKMNDTIAQKIKNSFKHLQGRDPYLHEALESAEINL